MRKLKKCVTIGGRLIFVLFNLLAIAGNSQPVQCPPNLDFGNGTFTNWFCRTGTVYSVDQTIYTWEDNLQVEERHSLIRADTAGSDPYGLFPRNCPNGNFYTVKLGNDEAGALAEGMSYTYDIPASITDFTIIYYYAVVFQDPGHAEIEQPRFSARVIDASTEREIECVSFNFIASSGLPGFRESRLNPGVLYKGWTPVTIDLSSYAGKTVRLEFITNDCTKGGHFGYAYVALDPDCKGGIPGSMICEVEKSARLVAPFGYQNYIWYADNSFSQEIGHSQILNLTPAPADGSIIPVKIIPYPGFGCEDTLYADIRIMSMPVSVAGPDHTVCRNTPVQLGTALTAGYEYLWTPAYLVNNAMLANPMASSNVFRNVSFVVKTTDLSSGCFTYDTAIVRTVPVDTSLVLAGRLNYCEGENLQTSFTAANGLSWVNWQNGPTGIAGAINQSYQPSATGVYWALVSQNNCTDSTRRINFNVNPLPQAAFSTVADTLCAKTDILFTNNSTIPDAAELSYVWKFGDGSFSTESTPTKVYTGTGNYTAELVAISPQQCRDSIAKQVAIFPNAIPDFEWDTICENRPVLFRNLTMENGATDISYQWDFKNGFLSQEKDVPAFAYTAPGVYEVSLEVRAKGCETSPSVIVKQVEVHDQITAKRYPRAIMISNEPAFIEARQIGIKYEWLPRQQLDNYNIRRPLFQGETDIQYLIGITDQYTCTTVDTLQVMILKEEAVYMPSAFSPNNDGLNDIIKPYIVGLKSLKRFSVYNRSGNIIFSTTDPAKGWDGTYLGKNLSAGVFVWVIEYVDKQDKVLLSKGTITLVK